MGEEDNSEILMYLTEDYIKFKEAEECRYSFKIKYLDWEFRYFNKKANFTKEMQKEKEKSLIDFVRFALFFDGLMRHLETKYDFIFEYNSFDSPNTENPDLGLSKEFKAKMNIPEFN